ncbi:hypothetical protein SELMODRAFT_184022 [Selaginella moellendorffii]|uniref:Amino acid transporter transmembrane domain-containing protein n=1 Tax=Selaginella moellendorffii TaxID=88036 RepID=D8SZ87_SELML|nr:auxin transporter-like protein 2 [Selaginella moellendorffii]EFJ10166.1 hypothetical protein SELMODRAFT_184022 [Selaginella moellendorffii]|eukprot:XP_002988655.1 auxin transporter-like protein 2 [Selaginella moellendorffii]
MVDIYEPDSRRHAQGHHGHEFGDDPYRYDGQRAWIQTKRGYIMHKFKQWTASPSANLLWRSSSSFDAFLIAAAAQIGQALTLLPQTLAFMGYGWGVFFLILYAAFGSWAVFLLVWLYLEYRIRNQREARDDLQMGHILQYHEVIYGLTGRYLGNLTLVFNILALAMAGVVQLISSASNLHYLNSNVHKREWQILVGILSLLSVFMPGFSHFRFAAFIGVLTTTITAVYLAVAARTNGQEFGITHRGAGNMREFFTGATTILFAFGGHGITIEILEAMHSPEKFGFVYPLAVLYILVLSIASSTSVYWAYGDDLLEESNAFAVLPPSHWKRFAIFSMFVHQSIAFIIYMYPVFLVAEKTFRVHTRRFAYKVLARLPVVLLVWFVAMAMPFFGTIAAVFGSLLVSISVYFIPLLAFYLAYRDKEAQKVSVVKLSLHYPIWKFLFLINALIMVWIFIIGFCVGAWATMSQFIRDIHTYGFFDKCYQCRR